MAISCSIFKYKFVIVLIFTSTSYYFVARRLYIFFAILVDVISILFIFFCLSLKSLFPIILLLLLVLYYGEQL